MKPAGIVAAVAISAIPLLAAPQKDSGATPAAGKPLTLRGCVAPGVDKRTYVLTQLSEATRGGQSAMPDSAHGRRVVFLFDKKDEMLKHVNQAVEVTGTINGFEESEIELKNGDAPDGGLLVEFEGPGKDVRVSNAAAGGVVGTGGRTTPDKNDIKTMLVKVKVTGVIVTADYPCAEPK
jgi:hypothetical protein